MKIARGNQEQVNLFAGKQNVEKENVKQSEARCYWCIGNHKEPRQQHCPAFRKRLNCGVIRHFSRACRSRGGRERQPQRQEANLVESEQDEEAFVREAISASSTGKKSAAKFFAHLDLAYKERRKSSGHKLILPLPVRVIPYLTVRFTSCFLVLKSQNLRLQLARMGIKSCTQRDK